jgi:hypothetical protein
MNEPTRRRKRASAVDSKIAKRRLGLSSHRL